MDKRAKKILIDTYWKSSGWRNTADRTTDPEDLQYAIDKGVMFAPFTIHHDECIQSLHRFVSSIDRAKVARAFLSSLSTRRLDWRSALLSWSISSKIPPHKYVAYNYSLEPEYPSYICGTCAEVMYGVTGRELYQDADISVLNFERIKWGGVRHGNILYMYVDLRAFDEEEIPQPTEEDLAIFRAILHTVQSSDQGDYPGTLAKRMKKVLQFNKNEREVVVEILAGLGVLEPQAYDRPVRGKSDWVFAEQWRGIDSYNQRRVESLFGEFL